MDGPMPHLEIVNNELILKFTDSSVEVLIFLTVISYSRDMNNF